ncbi:hypothetical protein ONE63_010333 [Megalurothrips usitatus]|uniref:Integrase catalytic domain-containing protein n=1 Tax=Megalurothrips usitatus TaxID=439358 RepID=A0AAV7XQ25_9NEOP|nr:hypothetical protein ONE63_010333 [Megalurothrips usitatus]
MGSKKYVMYGKLIKILRSDNGGEYCSEQFTQYFKDQGIIRQLTVKATPEQDGVSETANRTLLEKARALLKEAGLESFYWKEALETAVCLKNLSPTRAVKDMVPHEAWTGTKPNMSHLKVFGCAAYVHIDTKTSKKIGDRSVECIFMGYDDERKGYLLLDRSNPRRVFTDRSVKFNENKFPARRTELAEEKDNKTDKINPSGCTINCTTTKTSTEQRTNLNKNQEKDSDNFWEEYSSTSISRLSWDNASNSSITEIDIENISSVSDENGYERALTRTRAPKQFPGFVVYGTGCCKVMGVPCLSFSSKDLLQDVVQGSRENNTTV